MLLHLPIALPPGWLARLGYPGSRRFVGLYWSPLGDEVGFHDGERSGCGAYDRWLYLDLIRHPDFAAWLVANGVHLGNSDEQAEYWLVVDGGAGMVYAAPVAVAWGLALCQLGERVRFTTAAALVTELEEAQQQHRLDRTLAVLDRLDLLIVDELGYLSFSRAGAELLFQVFADRYERRSLLVTSNLPFGEWGSVFQGERMTAALLDRLTHRCDIFEMNGESDRVREAMKSKPTKASTSKK